MGMELVICLVLIVLVVALFALSFFKKKKFNENLNQLRTDLKVGDKVMTDSGVVGEVVDQYAEQESGVEQKYVVLKSGRGNNIGYFTVHINSIYYVFGKDAENEQKKVVVVAPKKAEIKPETKSEEIKPEQKNEATETKTEENK